jgi:hypothetical protein
MIFCIFYDGLSLDLPELDYNDGYIPNLHRIFLPPYIDDDVAGNLIVIDICFFSSIH